LEDPDADEFDAPAWSRQDSWENGDTEILPLNRSVRVPEVLGAHRRLFVRGEAGLGKTMLPQWIAVQSAHSAFDMGLEDWNDTVPFFIALRRHANGDLPPPEQFIAELGRHIAADAARVGARQAARLSWALVVADLTSARMACQ
jgi:hypothetical protein